MLSRFHLVQKRNGRTDRQTDRRTDRQICYINDMDIKLSLSLHFYLLYLHLNSRDGNDAKSTPNAFCAVGRRSPSHFEHLLN